MLNGACLNGAWLDRDELDKLLERAARVENHATAA
jgi:Zn-finger nucleic acid-binding protein